MSADNGIYVLKTKDQYRVAHLQAIDNVYWSAICGNCYDIGTLIPTRVVEMWGDCKFTRDGGKALSIAHKWERSLTVCEYGVCVITYNKTWKQILKEAQEYAKEEIEHIKKWNQENFWNMDRLQKIADGVYLSEWNNRKVANT